MRFGVMKSASASGGGGGGGGTWSTTVWVSQASFAGGVSGKTFVSYGKGTWLVIDEITTSTATEAAISWTTRTSNYGHTIGGIAYGNGIWVMGGARNPYSLRQSTDAISWTTINNTAFDPFYGAGPIGYGNGLWVAAGAYFIQTSTDTVTWTTRSYNIAGPVGVGTVAYGQSGTWMIVHSNGILRSTNAITWVSITNDGGASIDYGNGRWVAGSINNATLRYSDNDGITWSTANTFIIRPNSIAYGNGLWISIGGGAYVNRQILGSTNGLTWVTHTTGINVRAPGLAYGNGKFVHAGDSRTVGILSST